MSLSGTYAKSLIMESGSSEPVPLADWRGRREFRALHKNVQKWGPKMGSGLSVCRSTRRVFYQQEHATHPALLPRLRS